MTERLGRVALAALAVAAAAAVAAPGPSRAADLGDTRRFALVAGEPDGGAGTVRLRYAERDALRIHEILTKVGGVRPDDARLLLSAGASAFRRALSDLSARAAEARASGERTLLLVYYSGHAKDGALRLGAGRVELDDLRRTLETAPADVRIGLLDSCRSGAIARTKGVRPAPTFDVKAPGGPEGLVLIASSAGDEDSQESDLVGASWFTHHLASGLLGGADTSADGKVTLAEAYAYAYARTVGSTMGSAGGVQHPVFHYDLGGTGDVILSDLAPVTGGLLFPEASEGLYVVLDDSGRAVAEVAKRAGAPRRIALAPGRYRVKRRLADDSGLLVVRLSVDKAPVPVHDADMDRVPLERDPQKGYAGRRFALLAGLGAQRFFDRGARDGLFPPATLGGLELAIRDDLGHGLAWGADAAVGGGDGTLHLPGVDVPVRFLEVAGGLSIWRDFTFGRLTLAPGLRMGFTYLARSFPDDDEALPNQHFFTVTPGLSGGAAYRLTRRLSAVGRVRLSYLFYNVDEERNLGFVDGLLGVEYALSD